MTGREADAMRAAIASGVMPAPFAIVDSMCAPHPDLSGAEARSLALEIGRRMLVADEIIDGSDDG